MPPDSEASAAVPGRYLPVVLASLIVIGAGLKAAGPVLMPFCLAALLSVLVAPAVLWLEHRRLPAWLAVTLVGLAMMALFAALGALLTASVADFAAAIPEYRLALRKLGIDFATFLRAQGIEISIRQVTEVLNPGRVIEFAGQSLTGLLSGLTNTVVVLLIMVFILLELAGLPRKLRAAMEGTDNTSLARYEAMVAQVHRYLQIKTVLSLGTGLIVAGWTALLGLDFAPLWGLIAFLLNYVPNVGSILAAVPALLVAVVQLTWGGVLAVGAGYLAVNMVLGNIVEPAIMGRRLGLSPLVVFLALLFWGWLWGPVGMLLSVPITMIIKIMCEESRNYRWVAVLLDLPPALPTRRATRRHRALGHPPASSDRRPAAPRRCGSRPSKRVFSTQSRRGGWAPRETTG